MPPPPTRSRRWPGARRRPATREAPVRGERREGGEPDRCPEELAALVDHWPPTGRKPTGSGRGCPVRPASAKHCTISSRSPGAVYLKVIPPSRPTRSSVADVELHFAHRA